VRCLRRIAVAAAPLVALAMLAGSLPDSLAVTSEPIQLGTSVQGRPIEAVRLGDPDSPRKALVVGVLHGDEAAGLRVTKLLRGGFADLTDVDLWVVDAANPDGLSAHRRGNAHGVDLNRNFSYRWRPGRRDGYYPGTSPYSEPESAAMRDLITQIQPQVSVWFHQPWDAVLAPCHAAAPIEKRYARIAHMRRSCRGAKLHGTAIQWQNHTFPGTTAVVVELPPGKISEGLARRNARAVAAVAAG
jgi:protein MpaA